MEKNDLKDLDRIEARLNEAFTNDTFIGYRKITMVRWTGEPVDIFAKKIKQLVGLAGFEWAGMERLTKPTFVTGFPDTIGLWQTPNIETLTMEDLIARARVLTTTGDQSQDVAHPAVVP